MSLGSCNHQQKCLDPCALYIIVMYDVQVQLMQLQEHIPAALIATNRKSRSTGDLKGLAEDYPAMGMPKGMAEVKPSTPEAA